MSTTTGEAPELKDLDHQQLVFLAKLPEFLNSSLDIDRVIELVIEHLSGQLEAEAATVFLLSKDKRELTFFAPRGGGDSKLKGKKIPANVGIVGWVIKNRQPVLVQDAANDARFYSQIDKEGAFQTKSIICVPLIVRGKRDIGAVQVLNKKNGEPFTNKDLHFVENFSHQVALALDNALLYQEVRDKHEKLLKLDRRKNEMITVIAHEFRTPLNIIQNSADLVTTDNLKPENKEMAINLLTSGIQRLSKLVTEIRHISVVQNEQLVLKTCVTRVSTLLQEIHSKYTKIAAGRNLSLALELEDAQLDIYADPSLISLVFQNLISNAIRFTPDGGRILLSAKKHFNGVELAVADTGIGIEASELPFIFEKFYEIGDAMTHSSGDYKFKSGGLGLGLAAVHDILEAHDTAIKVESEFNNGSKFYFVLPSTPPKK